jgi:hypothetical protein
MKSLALAAVLVAGYFGVLFVMRDRALVPLRSRIPWPIFLAILTFIVGMPLNLALQLALHGRGSLDVGGAAVVTASCAGLMMLTFGVFGLLGWASGYRPCRIGWDEPPGSADPAPRLARAAAALAAAGFEIVVSTAGSVIARRNQRSSHAPVSGPAASLLYATLSNRPLLGGGLGWRVDVHVGTSVMWETGEQELCRSIGQRLVTAVGGTTAVDEGATPPG